MGWFKYGYVPWGGKLSRSQILLQPHFSQRSFDLGLEFAER